MMIVSCLCKPCCGDPVYPIGKRESNAVEPLLAAIEPAFQEEFPNVIKCDDLDNLNQSAEELDASHQNLAELPERVCSLCNLKFLNLAHNQLAELPESFVRLNQLRELDLSNNAFESVPCFILSCRRLSVLKLAHNKMKRFLNHIDQLPLLQTVDLSGNQLTKIPQKIYLLQDLTKLIVSHNQLSSLNDVDANLALPTLQKLDASHNFLTEFPRVIVKSHAIQSLNLSFNWLHRVDKDIQALENLEEFDLSHNGITYLPSQMGRLRRLKVLNLSHNRMLDTLPLSLGRISTLAAINIENTQIDPKVVERILEQTKARRTTPMSDHLENVIATWTAAADQEFDFSTLKHIRPENRAEIVSGFEMYELAEIPIDGQKAYAQRTCAKLVSIIQGLMIEASNLHEPLKSLRIV